jgi:hypothetical protein
MDITGELLFDILVEASNRLHTEIKTASKRGNLEFYLKSIGMEDIISKFEKKTIFEPFPNGKIIIFGDSQISEAEIYGVLKTCKIPKDKVELHLGYSDSKSYRFRNLQYNPNYRLVLFGPIPHSVESKEDSSSVIANLESTEGYPKVIRLTDGHQLKITKSGLKNVIEEQIRIGYLSY